MASPDLESPQALRPPPSAHMTTVLVNLLVVMSRETLSLNYPVQLLENS